MKSPEEILSQTGFFGSMHSPRDLLISALSAAVSSEHAYAILDALDGYLAEPIDGRVPPTFLRHPNPRAEVDQMRKERDEAIARAEKAEQLVRDLCPPAKGA